MARKTKQPTYRQQKREGRADLAFMIIGDKRTYLGNWDTEESRERYARIIAEWKASQSSPIQTENVHVMTLIARYWRHAKEYYGDDSPRIRQYKGALQIVKALYGRTLVDAFGPKSLKTVRSEMIEKGWTRKYVNAQVLRIRRMFKWGIAEEMVHPDTLARLDAVEGLRKGRTTAKEGKTVTTVSHEHIDAVKRHVSSQVAAFDRLTTYHRCKGW